MKLKELFKQAIIHADWNDVCKVYTKLTGEQIDPPNVPLFIPQKTEEEMWAEELTKDLKEAEVINVVVDSPIINSSVPPKPKFPSKLCPSCNTWVAARKKMCECGYDFKEKKLIESVVAEKDKNGLPLLKTWNCDDMGGPPSPHESQEKIEQEFSNVGDNFRIQHPQNSAPKKVVTQAGEEKNYGRRVPLEIKQRENIWLDDCSEHSDELVSERPELGVASPRSRTNIGVRGNEINVECSICGLKEMVSPILATGYSSKSGQNAYRCNDCCGSSNRER